MNEYDRLHRQAQRYKELYPKGTRILLLHMGDDPRPVEDDMRGTVMFVDDTSTVHCKFDNGRQLGIIPGEDSFRKLTDEELAEEQADGEDMDEDNGSVMGMYSKSFRNYSPRQRKRARISFSSLWSYCRMSIRRNGLRVRH